MTYGQAMLEKEAGKMIRLPEWAKPPLQEGTRVVITNPVGEDRSIVVDDAGNLITGTYNTRYDSTNADRQRKDWEVFK